MKISNLKLKKKEMNEFIQKLRTTLLDLPKSLKVIISISVDSFLCFLTTWLSFYLRLVEESRKQIINGTFSSWKDKMVRKVTARL